MKKIFFVIVSGLLFISCSNQSTTVQDSEKPFYDLKTFIGEEANRLNQEKVIYVKTISIDGEEERIEIESINWQKELEIFSQSDINRKDWFHKYSIDSTKNEESLTIEYEANSPKLKIRLLRIQLEDSLVKKIEIRKYVKSLVNTSEEFLTYYPEKGYLLNRKQKTPFSAEKNYNINTSFKLVSF